MDIGETNGNELVVASTKNDIAVIEEVLIKEELIVEPEVIIEEVMPKKPSPSKSPRRVKAAIVDDECEVEVPEGWRRQVVQRQGGLSAGKFDVYYFSPVGKKLRSKKEVQNHCDQNNIPYNLEMFRFTRVSLSNSSASKGRPRSIPSTPKTPKTPKTPCTPKLPKITPQKRNISKNSGLPNKKPMVKIERSPSLMKISSDGLTKKRKKSVWVPPKSPFNLFQESLFQNPWKLLVGTMIMNRSPGEETIKQSFLPEFFKKWPAPDIVMKANCREMAEFLKPVSTNDKMSKMIIKFSEEYLVKKWTYPKELNGIGRYGNDSYRIFCINEWKKVKPTDCLLNFYVHWLWDNHTVLGLD